MKAEQFQKFLLEHPHFKFATNLQTHLHLVEGPFGEIILSYFNQPLVIEVLVSDLHGDFQLSSELANELSVCLPFPCIEVFCPSFNGKTSLLVDVYKTGVLLCKKQFSHGLPLEFHDYKPISIKCAPRLN